MNKFLYTYKGVELLWEVVADHGSKGLLCRTVSGVFGGMMYYSCGASAYFAAEHVRRLISDAESRRLRRVSSHRTSELGTGYTVVHARQTLSEDQEREDHENAVHALLQNQA